MNRQKVVKIFAILLMVSWILPISFVNATDNFNFSTYDTPKSDASADKIAQNAMGIGINIIRVITTGGSVIMISYVAVKYMMAAPNEKAEFKKSATIFILGAILVFAAGNILSIIANFTASNISSG